MLEEGTKIDLEPDAAAAIRFAGCYPKQGRAPTYGENRPACLWCGGKLPAADAPIRGTKGQNVEGSDPNRRGRYGDGYFCGMRCGFGFADLDRQLDALGCAAPGDEIPELGLRRGGADAG